MKTLAMLLMTAIPCLAQVICPECQKDGKKSTVREDGTTSTLVAVQGSYDENGKYVQAKDPNITTTSYECSVGHRFNRKYSADSHLDESTTGKLAVVSSPDAGFFRVLEKTSTSTLAKISQDFLIIYTQKGKVTISLEDGSVKADPGVSMDEAAKVFWEAVKTMHNRK